MSFFHHNNACRLTRFQSVWRRRKKRWQPWSSRLLSSLRGRKGRRKREIGPLIVNQNWSSFQRIYRQHTAPSIVLLRNWFFMNKFGNKHFRNISDVHFSLWKCVCGVLCWSTRETERERESPIEEYSMVSSQKQEPQKQNVSGTIETLGFYNNPPKKRKKSVYSNLMNSTRFLCFLLNFFNMPSNNFSLFIMVERGQLLHVPYVTKLQDCTSSARHITILSLW